MPSLSLVVPTFRRLDHLRATVPRLLAQLEDLQQSGIYLAGKQTSVTVALLIIDNDPAASARKIVTEAAQTAAVAVRYVNEQTPGVVAVRNRALDECSTQDLLVFVDDDDVPSSGWLRALVDMWARTGAQAVTGPTPPFFEAEPDAWVQASDVLASPRHPDGAQLASAFTNNLLLDLVFLRANRLRFDPAYGLTGGEDSDLTRRLSTAGGLIVWAADAVVDIRIEPERAQRTWMLMRATRSGASWSSVRLGVTPPWRRPAQRLAYLTRGLARAAQSQTQILAAQRQHNTPALARAETRRAGGLGIAAGALGWNIQEYKRTAK